MDDAQCGVENRRMKMNASQFDINSDAIELIGLDQGAYYSALFAENEEEAKEIATELFLKDCQLIKSENGQSLYFNKIEERNYILKDGIFYPVALSC